MIDGKWFRRLGALLAVLLWLPLHALADGPCTCEDLCKLEKRLKEKQRLLEAAQKVAQEARDKTFPTVSWAKGRFIQIAFPTGKYRVEATQEYGEKPTYSEEFKKGNCDSILKATEWHEDDHTEYDKTVPNWLFPWIMIFGQEGEFIANKEVGGHLAEVTYLASELAKLRQKCPEVDCDPKEPEPPQLELYQEQNEAYRQEQKQRLERAAQRVAMYAGSIR